MAPLTGLNYTRYLPAQQAGHYESFFQRANHPTRPLAFWIRYTIFSPKGRSAEAVGELWAIFFDGERGQHTAVKQEWPISQCRFARDQFAVQVGEATLGPMALRGACAAGNHAIAWDLRYKGEQPPIFLLPPNLYEGGFPKAKSLVGLPLAVYNGELIVDGQPISIDGWVGSQNHNWGSQHTDLYAWGQVAGFDNAPDSFLEVATARLQFGPVWTPPFTPLALRHGGQEYTLTALGQSLRSRGAFTYFRWTFAAETSAVKIMGTISAPPAAFVGLRYGNPPGGSKQCLNSKIAACELLVLDKASGQQQSLITAHRAAFEILTNDTAHGIPIQF